MKIETHLGKMVFKDYTGANAKPQPPFRYMLGIRPRLVRLTLIIGCEVYEERMAYDGVAGRFLNKAAKWAEHRAFMPARSKCIMHPIIEDDAAGWIFIWKDDGIERSCEYRIHFF